VGGGIRPWAAVFAGALALYALTCARVIQWQDPGHFVLRIVTGDLRGELGLALSHPLHHWLGRAATSTVPIEPAWAVALVSALAGAAGVANVFGLVRTLTGRIGGALLGAAALGLAHTYWRMAAIPEVYTISAALLAAELWCVVLLFQRGGARWLVLACLFNGLGLANHNTALLTAPVLIAAFVLCRGPVRPLGRTAAACSAAWLLGSLPYTGLVVHDMIATGKVAATIGSALFGEHFADEAVGLPTRWRPLLISGAFTMLSFPNLTLAAVPVGLVVARRVMHRRLLGLLIAAGGIHLLFAVRYDVVDQHTFFLPTYTIAAIFAGLGYQAILDAARRASAARWLARLAVVCVLATPATYWLATQAARSLDVLESVERHRPYRDDYVYLFHPWAVTERSAHRMSRQAVELAAPDGLIVAGPGMGRFALEYAAHMSGYSPVDVVGPGDRAALAAAIDANRPVVWVPKHTHTRPPEPPRGRWRARGEIHVLQTPAHAPP
jgi:hypothetical protein